MRFWEDKRVLITGCTGLIGSHLTKELVNQKSEVIAIVRDWVPNSIILTDNLKNKINIIRGDIADLDLLTRVINEYEIEIVFHLAAQTIVKISNNNPISTFESNIRGTWNLLEACRNIKNIKSIILASSDKAYGDSETMPYNEVFPLNAIYPYDVSKACADMIALSYAKTFYLPVCITRCGNFFGGGDLNWNRIVPGTIRSVIKETAPIIRSDGKMIRDYIYVEDAVSAYLILAEKLFFNPKLSGEVFNFSNETKINVLEITNLIISLMKSDLSPQIKDEVSYEIKEQSLDSAKAKKVLGWESKFSISNGLNITIDWYRKFFDAH